MLVGYERACGSDSYPIPAVCKWHKGAKSQFEFATSSPGFASGASPILGCPGHPSLSEQASIL